MQRNTEHSANMQGRTLASMYPEPYARLQSIDVNMTELHETQGIVRRINAMRRWLALSEDNRVDADIEELEAYIEPLLARTSSGRN